MNILTGNDLVTGDVVWWTGDGWSRDVDDAADTGDDGEAILAREEAARRVNAPYLIDGERDGTGVRPAHIKDRVRAVGPTVRPDLTREPSDENAIEWVV